MFYYLPKRERKKLFDECEREKLTCVEKMKKIFSGKQKKITLWMKKFMGSRAFEGFWVKNLEIFLK
jgi:hypothetical protein